VQSGTGMVAPTGQAREGDPAGPVEEIGPPSDGRPGNAAARAPKRVARKAHAAHAPSESNRPSPKTAVPVPNELGLIRKATGALRDGQPTRALQLLAEHARHHPEGMLAQERQGLRVLALCAAGRQAEGAAARTRFLRAAPRSPLAGRVEDACGGADGVEP